MSFLPPDHLGRRVLSCPAAAELCLSIRRTLVTTLQPTIYNRFCSYFTQLLTLVGAWNLLIMGSMCSFSRILWYFKILQIHWLTGIGVCPFYHSSQQPTICDESCSYLGQPLALVRAWTLLIIGSLWLFLRMPQHFEILWIQTDWWFWVLVRYLSIAYNFTWILFIFSTAIGIS